MTQGPTIDAKDAKPFLCPKCKGNIFTMVCVIYQVSRFAKSNTTGQDLTFNQPRYKCDNRKCGHIVKEVIPR